MYEQDATVRMQLGRRLEQILLDKEEYKDEIEEMKEHILRLEQELVIYKDAERDSQSQPPLVNKSPEQSIWEAFHKHRIVPFLSEEKETQS